jgi:hypothetical protein
MHLVGRSKMGRIMPYLLQISSEKKHNDWEENRAGNRKRLHHNGAEVFAVHVDLWRECIDIMI